MILKYFVPFILALAIVIYVNAVVNDWTLISYISAFFIGFGMVWMGSEK